MTIIARKLLIPLLAGAALAATPRVLESRGPAAPPAAVSVITPAAESCGPPAPVMPRRARAEEEGCTETPPSPALARR